MSYIQPHRSGSVLRNVLLGIAVLAVVGSLTAVAIFFANGGRWFVVATPSMGTTAPVGTLVLSTPTTTEQLHVGDIISFHPPTAPSETYTHRVVAISDAGAISTRGDINGSADGWQLHQKDLIGRVAVVIPAIGWLVRAVPILVIGFAAVWLITLLVRSSQWRAAFRLVGGTLVVAIASLILRPFTGLVLLETSRSGGQARATVVSTGLMPIRVAAQHGTTAHLVDGQVGTVTIPSYVHEHFYRINSALDLGFWGWVLFLLICCIPLFAVLIFGLPAREFSLDERRPIAQHDPVVVAERREQRRRFEQERFA